MVISHSLPVVAQLATRVAVMQAGRLVEVGPAEQVLSSPQHPYTKALLAAVPELPVNQVFVLQFPAIARASARTTNRRAAKKTK